MPWFNDGIKEARRLRRRAERRWRRSGLEADLLAYKAIKNKTNHLINEARKVFFTELVEENCTDQRKLFLVTKRLLGREKVMEYPQFDDKIARRQVYFLFNGNVHQSLRYSRNLVLNYC